MDRIIMIMAHLKSQKVSDPLYQTLFPQRLNGQNLGRNSLNSKAGRALLSFKALKLKTA